eukprot:gene843-4115_t
MESSRELQQVGDNEDQNQMPDTLHRCNIEYSGSIGPATPLTPKKNFSFEFVKSNIPQNNEKELQQSIGNNIFKKNHQEDPLLLIEDYSSPRLENPQIFHEKYTLNNDVLGSGAFAVVHICHNRQNFKRCAVKIVDQSQEVVKSRAICERETLLVCKKSQNIVDLLDFYTDNLKYYFVFELLEGGDLLDNISRRSQFVEREASLAARDIALALEFLHQRGIVHRDIKPQNILCQNISNITPAKLCDLNLVYNPNFSDASIFKEPAGTIEYMSPEMAEALSQNKDAPNNSACDLWGLGVVLYVILSGHHPFVGEHRIASFVNGDLLDLRIDEILEDIITINFSMESSPWDVVSDAAKQLVITLLVMSNERPTAEDVLSNEWINDTPETSIHLHTPKNLRENAFKNNSYSFDHAEEFRGLCKKSASTFLFCPLSALFVCQMPPGYWPTEAMADVSDPQIQEAVFDVRRDDTETDWCAFGYKNKNTLHLAGKGSGGHTELLNFLREDEVYFCLLRIVDGDQESKRIKFVALTYVGEGVSGMNRGRVGVHSGSIRPLLGQCNIDISADNKRECTREIITKKLKVAGGADYDTGSNAGGYKSEAKSLRAKALATYQSKEKEGTIKSFVYVKSALPSTTPVDLSGRKTVAPPTEARRNIRDSVLDTEKFRGRVSTYSENSFADPNNREGKHKPQTSAKPPALKRKPSTSGKPAQGEKLGGTMKPPVSSKPLSIAAAKPVRSEKPAVTKKPTVTAKPPPDSKPLSTVAAKPARSEKPTVTKKPTVTAKPPPNTKPLSMAAAKPARSEKPAVTEKPSPDSKPLLTSDSKPSEKTAITANSHDNFNPSNTMPESISTGPIIEDSEERARLRVEARKAKREANALKAREEVRMLKASLGSPRAKRKYSTEGAKSASGTTLATEIINGNEPSRHLPTQEDERHESAQSKSNEFVQHQTACVSDLSLEKENASQGNVESETLNRAAESQLPDDNLQEANTEDGTNTGLNSARPTDNSNEVSEDGTNIKSDQEDTASKAKKETDVVRNTEKHSSLFADDDDSEDEIFGSVQYKSETNHVDDTKDLPSSEEEMDKAEMQEDSTEAVVPTQSSATLMVKTEMQEDSTEAVAPTHSSTTVEVPFDILVTFLQSNGVLPIPYNVFASFFALAFLQCRMRAIVAIIKHREIIAARLDILEAIVLNSSSSTGSTGSCSGRGRGGHLVVVLDSS